MCFNKLSRKFYVEGGMRTSFNGHNNLNCLFPLLFPEKFSSKFFHGDPLTKALNFPL